MMRRREFCKLIASAAASTAVPTLGQSGESGQSLNGFGTITGDYATYCATPADQRVFYALEDGKFIKVKLDDKTGNPPPGVKHLIYRFPGVHGTAFQ